MWGKITDEDMLEKTYTTFHASNVLLQQQYRERASHILSLTNLVIGKPFTKSSLDNFESNSILTCPNLLCHNQLFFIYGSKAN